MKDFWVEMALSVLFGVLKDVVKNPSKKADLSRAMLKLRGAIDVAYGDESGTV